MTKEQKQYKLMIMADLKIVESYYADKEKTLRLQAAYHMQQAVEKTIKHMLLLNGKQSVGIIHLRLLGKIA